MGAAVSWLRVWLDRRRERRRLWDEVWAEMRGIMGQDEVRSMPRDQRHRFLRYAFNRLRMERGL